MWTLYTNREIFSLHGNCASVLFISFEIPFGMVVVAVFRARKVTLLLPFCFFFMCTWAYACVCVKIKELNTNKIINKMRWRKKSFSFSPSLEMRDVAMAAHTVVIINNRRTFDEIFTVISCPLFFVCVYYVFYHFSHSRSSFSVSIFVCLALFWFWCVCPFSFIVSNRIKNNE